MSDQTADRTEPEDQDVERDVPPDPNGAPAEDDQRDQEAEPQGSDDDADPTAGRGSNREAAKYRHKLRETEAELEAVKAELENTQWGVAKANFKALNNVEPLKAAGYTVADLLDDNGHVSAEKARKVEADYAKSLGFYVQRPTLPDLGGGKRGTYQSSEDVSWSEALDTAKR